METVPKISTRHPGVGLGGKEEAGKGGPCREGVRVIGGSGAWTEEDTALFRLPAAPWAWALQCGGAQDRTTVPAQRQRIHPNFRLRRESGPSPTVPCVFKEARREEG